MTRKARASGRVRLVKRLSHDAAEHVQSKIDFIFIDGDHSIEAIHRDWETWTSRIKPGGIVALHDSYPAPNSPITLGSQKFYGDVISRDDRFDEFACKGSLAVLRNRYKNP